MLTEKTIAVLKEKAKKYNVKRLLLFGSCLRMPEAEAEAGDIDLAVDIDRENYLPLYTELLFDKDINKSIDLVDLSGFVTILPVIMEDNVVIYES